jgi:hypothetical protein
VDGSHASSKHHTGCSSQIPVEYNIQIRCTQVGPFRQWYSVQRGKVRKVLYKLWHQSPSIIGDTPSDEWASRASKWTHSAGG